LKNVNPFGKSFIGGNKAALYVSEMLCASAGKNILQIFRGGYGNSRLNVV